MHNVKRSETSLLRKPIHWGVVALIGSIAAVVCLLVFVSDLSRIVEVDINGVIASFVLCGMATGIALILLRRALPKREPQTLFGGAFIGIVQDPRSTDIPAAMSLRPDGTRITHPEHSGPRPNPVMVSHGSENVARYSTHESAGALGLVCMIAMSVGLGTRFGEGWAFLSLAVLTGAAMALVLYWIGRYQQNSTRRSYMVPTAGGVLASAAMLGIGVVMMQFPFLRLFLQLVLGAGVFIALALDWASKRHASSSLVQAASTPASHVTMQSE